MSDINFWMFVPLGESMLSLPERELSLQEISSKLEHATPSEIIRWAIERYFPKITMATAFGAEGCCIIHMVAAIEPRMHIFNLDTGYQFKETLELRDRIAERYGIEVKFVRAETTVSEYEALHGGPLYTQQPDRCCHDRKIVPLKKAVVGFDAWISAIRRDQTAHRKDAGIVELDKKFGLVKVNPLANWTKSDVWSFVMENRIPYNPLHDQGYPSIGCWPCTRAVVDGDDDRAGRWGGTGKTECGLHLKD